LCRFPCRSCRALTCTLASSCTNVQRTALDFYVYQNREQGHSTRLQEGCSGGHFESSGASCAAADACRCMPVISSLVLTTRNHDRYVLLTQEPARGRCCHSAGTPTPCRVTLQQQYLRSCSARDTRHQQPIISCKLPDNIVARVPLSCLHVLSAVLLYCLPLPQCRRLSSRALPK
jgi:hypothetical protein